MRYWVDGYNQSLLLVFWCNDHPNNHNIYPKVSLTALF
ncbi:hypothetical protein AO371_1380 [Moraxella catarrhalis]|nr:hypothetical protein AO371_1380 [Moraxella catarrhalis]